MRILLNPALSVLICATFVGDADAEPDERHLSIDRVAVPSRRVLEQSQVTCTVGQTHLAIDQINRIDGTQPLVLFRLEVTGGLPPDQVTCWLGTAFPRRMDSPPFTIAGPLLEEQVSFSLPLPGAAAGTGPHLCVQVDHPFQIHGRAELELARTAPATRSTT